MFVLFSNDIRQLVSEGSFDFEITRVDCILLGEGAGCGVADGALKLVTLNPNPLPMRGVESSKTTLSHQSSITDRSKMVLQLWF